MKITALPPQKHDPDRVSIFVDGEFRMGLSAEVVLAAGLRIGDVVSGRLRELGMIDDAAFAGTLVRDRVRLRPQGARRLASELRQKGVDEETARAAIRETMEGEATDERELARRAAEKWRARPG